MIIPNTFTGRFVETYLGPSWGHMLITISMETNPFPEVDEVSEARTALLMSVKRSYQWCS